MRRLRQGEFTNKEDRTLDNLSSIISSDQKHKMRLQILKQVNSISIIYQQYLQRTKELGASFQNSGVWNNEELEESRFIFNTISLSVEYLNAYRIFAKSLVNNEMSGTSLAEWERARDEIINFIEIQLLKARFICLVMSDPFNNDYETTYKHFFPDAYLNI